MFNVSWGWSYTHSRWSVGKHCTHDGPPLWWSSFTGALILVLHGQCVTQVTRGDIVIILDWCFILEWCLCDFLLLLSLKHIDEVDGFPSSFVTYWCWHIFCMENILRFQYCFGLFTDVDYFSCAKISYHSQLMFMLFSITEIYRWSARTSCWFVIYLCWHNFCVENILEFQYCAKCCYHSWLMFMWFSVTEIYWWSGWSSIFICQLLMLTYFLCGKYPTISILLWIIYWCWLFFMCKMFLSFSTDVYVIFCYWNISMKWTHFMLICHLLMLTYFLCRKYSRISILVLIIYWCWLFFMCKMLLSFQTDFMWFSVTEIYHWSGWISIFICHLLMLTYFLCGKYSTISILLWIIYWCWLYFMCKMFLSFSTDVYVIFCYWNISMKCMHFMLICHLLMLT